MKKISFFVFLCVFYCLTLRAQSLYRADKYYSSVPMNISYGRAIEFKHKLTYTGPAMLCTVDTNGNYKTYKYVVPSSYFDVSNDFAIVGDTLYFPGSTDNVDFEIYKFDGINPIKLAVDVLPGPNPSWPSNLIAYNNKLYFEAYTPAYGKELWEYDPATGGKKIISDTYPGTTDGYVSHMNVFNGLLYFSSRDASNKFNLYTYNSVTSVVKKRTNLLATFYDAQPNNLTNIGSKMYFICAEYPPVGPSKGTQIYSIDTNDVVTQLTDKLNSNSINGSNHTHCDGKGFGVFNGNLYFMAGDGSIGENLYMYNTVSGVTTLIKHMNNTPTNYPLVSGHEFITYKNKLYFSGDDSTHAVEFWVYDGVNPPMMMKDINVGLPGSFPTYFTYFNNRVFLAAGDTDIHYGVPKMYILGDTPTKTSVVKINSFNGDVKVYPNPAHTNAILELTLKADAGYSLLVTDITGRIVYVADKKQYVAGVNKIIIPMSNVAASTYYYTLLDADNKACITGQIVKE